jgi:hypothetical protein
MNRVIKSQTVKPAIPLIGLPLKDYGGIFVATRAPCRCILRIDYRLTRCRNSKPQEELKRLDTQYLSLYVNQYLNNIFLELFDLCIDSSSDIKCECFLPDIIRFIIITTETVFGAFNVKKVEYEDYLKTLAILDNKFWSINPTYTLSLRCAYVYQGLCIVRDVYESIKLSAIDIDLDFVKDIRCTKLCLELSSPYDSLSTSLLLKFSSHVVSKIAQDITSKGFITKETLKYLRLLYDIETGTVFEILSIDKDEILGARGSFIKPIADIASVKFYKLRISSVDG